VQKIASRIHPVLYFFGLPAPVFNTGAGVLLPAAFIPEKGHQLQGLFSEKLF